MFEDMNDPKFVAEQLFIELTFRNETRDKRQAESMSTLADM
jgi:hypothetical protein